MTTDKPSTTAMTILRSLVMQAQDPKRRPVIPASWTEPHERMLRAVDPAGEKWIEKSKSAGTRNLMYLLEGLVLPGVQIHYILRKRCIEDLARNCIVNSGFTQVVNIAAGFDSLCYRLHWEFPSVNFFELDHPSTQSVKRRGLDAMGYSSSLTLLPIDLSHATLADTLLAEPAYDRNAPTLFIAEGLLMYLDARVITSVFETIYHHSGPGSCFVFTFIEHLKGAGGGTPLLRWWLKKKSEPFTWAIARDKVEEFTGDMLFDLDEIVDAEHLRNTYLKTAGLEKFTSTAGELIAVTTRP
jgi:methyltransferase (TIGR00027 family)